MSEDSKTKIITDKTKQSSFRPSLLAPLKKPVFSKPVNSDLSALYEILRTHPDLKTRKDAATYLLKIAENDEDIDVRTIQKLYHSEKKIEVATLLKRVLNKIKIKQKFDGDPTSKYDRKLTSEEETRIQEEIARLKSLYDRFSQEEGAFDRRYKVQEDIGEGGMAKIFRAIRLQDNREVAVKFLLLEDLAKKNDREKLIARFKREGQILQRLDHPHIIKCFESGEADGEYFLVMEYVEGGNLEALIKKGVLDLKLFKEIALQLCEAVGYIHKNGIIHRDIKPGNILIASKDTLGDRCDDACIVKGNVIGGKMSDVAAGRNPIPTPITIKLSDFGLAKDKKGPNLSKFSFQAGTDEYSSPQQLHDARDADERDDIFSMGKTFLEMLEGTNFATTTSHDEEKVSESLLFDSLNTVLKKCVAAEKEDRFQNVSAMRKELEDIFDRRRL